MLCAVVHSITTMRTCSAAASGTRSPSMMNCGAMGGRWILNVCALCVVVLRSVMTST
jgi:hypothetical protein